MQDNYFGEIISAFCSLSKFIFKTTVRSIRIDNFIITILKRRKLFFVSICPGRMKNHKIFRRLYTIASNFCSIYSEEEIKNWDHNIKKFDNFHKEMKHQKTQIIGDFLDKLWPQKIAAVN
ncbi:MAG: hypothetical protein ACFFC3_11150 [Candidatus Odinarchaeota archaeon]